MDVLGIAQTIGVALMPLVIVIAITQFLKIRIYVKMADKLKSILSFVTPGILGAVFYFIWGMPNFNLWTWLQNVGGTWAFAVLGYTGIKAIFGDQVNTIGASKPPAPPVAK
jgi:hypothetical protein